MAKITIIWVAMTSQMYNRHRFATQNPVGPGRYDIQKWHEKQHRNGQTSAFRSKSEIPNHARAKFLQWVYRDLRPISILPKKQTSSNQPWLSEIFERFQPMLPVTWILKNNKMPPCYWKTTKHFPRISNKFWIGFSFISVSMTKLTTERSL